MGPFLNYVYRILSIVDSFPLVDQIATLSPKSLFKIIILHPIPKPPKIMDYPKNHPSSIFLNNWYGKLNFSWPFYKKILTESHVIFLLSFSNLLYVVCEWLAIGVIHKPCGQFFEHLWTLLDLYWPLWTFVELYGPLWTFWTYVDLCGPFY